MKILIFAATALLGGWAAVPASSSDPACVCADCAGCEVCDCLECCDACRCN